MGDAQEGKERFGRLSRQYLTATAACLGSFSIGCVLGWSAPCVEILKGEEYGFDELSVSVIAAILPAGAAIGSIGVSFLIDRRGRKWTMLALVPLFVIGWLFIIQAGTDVPYFIIGRFVTGACSGMFCGVIPLYTAEISEKQIRGTLGVFFQLLLVIGILYAYCTGFTRDVYWVSVLCGVCPIVFGIAMFFMPESPLFYVSKGNMEAAKKSMRFLRGPDFNFDDEISAFEEQVEKSKTQKVRPSYFMKGPVLKTLGVAYGLMFLQQLSGINAIIFYGVTLFEATGVGMDSLVQQVIFAVAQVVACIISASTIDKVGRKFLMATSSATMCVCLVCLSGFFILKDLYPDDVDKVAWLPLTSVCVYIIAFCLGAGPIPWAYMGEIFTAKLKGAASSTVVFFNWFLAFIVTMFFDRAVSVFGISLVLFFFAIVCAVGVFFVKFCMVETKGKTFAEIQKEFGTFDLEDD